MGSSNTYDQEKLSVYLELTWYVTVLGRLINFFPGDCVYRKEGKTKIQKTLDTDRWSSIPHREVYKHKLLEKVHFKS